MRPTEDHVRLRIVKLLMIGKPVRETARIVGVSESTVKAIKATDNRIAPRPRKGNR